MASSNDIIAECQNIHKLLYKQPPDIVVVDQDASEGYAFHKQTLSMWRFICIIRHYVDKWMATEDDQAFKLALKTILKSVINHEIGHWLNTLLLVATKKFWTQPPITCQLQLFAEHKARRGILKFLTRFHVIGL
jgi:hypothetical protein